MKRCQPCYVGNSPVSRKLGHAIPCRHWRHSKCGRWRSRCSLCWRALRKAIPMPSSAPVCSHRRKLWLRGQRWQWLLLHLHRPEWCRYRPVRFARDRHWIDAPSTSAAGVAPTAVAGCGPAQTFISPAVASTEMFATADNILNPALNSTGSVSMDQRYPSSKLRDLFADSCGEDLGHATAETSFLELGFDSLF